MLRSEVLQLEKPIVAVTFNLELERRTCENWMTSFSTCIVTPVVINIAFSFRYNNVNNNVLVYRISDDLPLGQSVSFQYKATTVSNLSPSIYVSSPVYLDYVTLPPSLAPREGRKYEENSDQVLCNVCL